MYTYYAFLGRFQPVGEPRHLPIQAILKRLLENYRARSANLQQTYALRKKDPHLLKDIGIDVHALWQKELIQLLPRED
jgi:hypothetical protein